MTPQTGCVRVFALFPVSLALSISSVSYMMFSSTVGCSSHISQKLLKFSSEYYLASRLFPLSISYMAASTSLTRQVVPKIT